jgi:hypothetical protein
VKNKIYLLVSLLTCVTLFGQPGKNGALTISTQTILNSYSPLTANAAIGSTVVTVLSPTTFFNFCPGDLIMIYQAQGATISTTNAASYGTVAGYNSSGLFEFVYVKKITGNTIELSSALSNSYSSAGMAQVVQVPQYSTLTINAAASIQPKPWKDTMISTIRYRFGGIVAIHAQGITNNGTITASGAGFRGGQLDIGNSGYTQGNTDYVTTVISRAGEKGESIAGYQPEYDVMSGRYGRGAPANGGGGGCGWNAGGGGGANGNNTNVWTGQGVMIVNSSNPAAAWMLDPAYAANGNSLTTSSGGGRGGYSLAFANANATVTGPNNPGWSGDNRREVGGLGGRPLTNISGANRIYFGGGGGAGDENDSNGGAGGTGGGIVYLIATNTVSGSGTISSDGNNGFNTTGNGVDAPGGAGAGGSIIIIAGSVSSSQTISATGGKGGDQFVNGETEGPGGGGGGGFVAISTGTLVPNISGNTGGSTNSPALTEFPFNGATAGAAGQTGTVANTFISFQTSSFITAANNSAVCEGGNLNLMAASGIGVFPFSWAGPNSFSSMLQNPTIANVQLNASGVYTLSLNISGCPSLTTTTSVTIILLPAITVNSPTVCSGQSTTLTAHGANTYTWMPGNTTGSVVAVSNLTTTAIYTITGQSSSGCLGSSTSTVTVGSPGSVLVSPSATLICRGQPVTLTASGAGNYTWQPNNSNGPSTTVSPQTTTTYTVSGFFGTCPVVSTATVSVNDCTGLSQWEHPAQKFAIYPNPSTGSFSILPLNEEPFDVRIYNGLGEVIFTQANTSGKTSFDLADYPKGVYYLVIKQEENKRYDKIIVE